MKYLFRIGIACGLASLAVLGAATHASARAACTPGTKVIGIATYTQWCGSARVAYKVDGVAHSIKGGKCALEHNGPYKFVVHVGRSTTGVPKSKYNYFQLDAQSSSPGTSHNGGVIWQLSTGKSGQFSNATVTLASGLKSGTFKGGTRKHPVTGSFHC